MAGATRRLAAKSLSTGLYEALCGATNG